MFEKSFPRSWVAKQTKIKNNTCLIFKKKFCSIFQFIIFFFLLRQLLRVAKSIFKFSGEKLSFRGSKKNPINTRFWSSAVETYVERSRNIGRAQSKQVEQCRKINRAQSEHKWSTVETKVELSQSIGRAQSKHRSSTIKT